MSQLANNPMSIAAADVAGGALTLFKFWAQIHHFEYQKGAAGDTVLVKDSLGNTVWETTQQSDLEPEISQLIGDVNGLVVPVTGIVGTGTLLVYFR